MSDREQRPNSCDLRRGVEWVEQIKGEEESVKETDMPALVKRHWLSMVLATPILGLFVMWLTVAVLTGRPQVARAQGVEGALPALAPYDHGQVERLREGLCLANRDLAAIGCDEANAEHVLTAVRSWYESNKATLTANRQAEAQIRMALRQAMRRISIGPRDDVLLTSLPKLQTDLANATATRQNSEESVIPTVNSLLTLAQQEVWLTARQNSAAPLRYRYVRGLSSEQAEQLRSAIRPAGDESTSIIAAEPEVLSMDQRNEISAAESKIHLYSDGTTKAQQSILPVPDELIPIEAPLEDVKSLQ